MKFPRSIHSWKALLGTKTPRGDSPAAGISAGNTLQLALQALLDCRTQDERKTLLKSRPELVTAAAQETLSRLVSQTQDERTKHLLQQCHNLILRCRDIGIDAAFNPIPETPPGAPLGYVLQALLNTHELEKKKIFIQSHPELLSAEAETMLSHFIKTSEDERARIILDRHRTLVEWCRKAGVDAAFAEVARQSRVPPPDPAIGHNFAGVFTATSLAEMEHAIRADPRIVERGIRETFKLLLATKGNYGLPEEKILVCLQILADCEENGIDATFAALRKSGVVSLRASSEQGGVEDRLRGQVLNRLIKKFEAGGAAAEVSREAFNLIALFSAQPQLRDACMLLAMVASVRAAEHAQARTLVTWLYRSTSFRPLSGMPTEVIGPAVLADINVDSVMEALETLRRAGDGTPEEQDAIRGLLAEYAVAKAQRGPKPEPR